MARSRKGKRSIVVNGEEFLWRYWNGGAHVIDLKGELNIKAARGLIWVRGPRFRLIKGCGGLHRCFRGPDHFAIATGPSQVAQLVRWAIYPGRGPEEELIPPPRQRRPADAPRRRSASRPRTRG